MITYQVRAYTREGKYAFGATLNCRDTEAAIERFQELPLDGHRAELIFRGKVICTRSAEAEDTTGRASGN